MDTVIILGARNDCHALHMMRACQQYGQHAVLFDTSSYPHQSTISWNPSTLNGNLQIDGQHYPFEQIKSVFWSTISQPLLGQGTQNPVNQIAQSDSNCALRTFFEEPRIHWMNSWRAFDFHRIKPRQLSLAKQLGITIPETYIGNDASQLLMFANSFEKTICKPVYGGAHTVSVTKDLLVPERLKKALRYAPITLQEHIEGTNIRTYVINDHVYSAEISSDSLDFRSETDPEHRAITTPPEIVRQALSICRAFEMQWTAIDWRKKSNGEYVFLEANPSPMFVHFERVTNYPITDNLVSMLCY